MKREAEQKAALIDILSKTSLTVAEINALYKQLLVWIQTYSRPDETP